MEVRESLSSLTSFVNAAPAGQTSSEPLYEVRNLAALGSARVGSSSATDPQRLIVASGFHAHPFREPLTAENYVRARWFDPQNGVWLTPDPMGYQDSSNLYAYAAGDPVNGRDPNGQYEADFHYGLTMYLALKAGFVRQVALLVAEGAERPDQDSREPVKNGFKAKLGSDTAKNTLREWHFPKPELMTGAVEKCSDSATAKLKHAMETGNITDFGESLHPFEDSWSHQGVPPLGFAGHARGGLLSHNADLTFKYPADAMEAAEATYGAMMAFAFKHPHEAAGSQTAMPAKPADWSQLQGEIEQFVHYSTKSEKRKWLLDRGIDLAHTRFGTFSHSIWDDVNLPEGAPPPPAPGKKKSLLDNIMGRIRR